MKSHLLISYRWKETDHNDEEEGIELLEYSSVGRRHWRREGDQVVVGQDSERIIKDRTIELEEEEVLVTRLSLFSRIYWLYHVRPRPSTCFH